MFAVTSAVRLGLRRHWLSLLLLTLAAAVACSLAAGPMALSPEQIVGALLNRHESATIRAVILGIRLPRALLAALVGAALGSAGGAFQAVLRNPLADPYILGVSGGAALGAVAAMAFGVHSALAVPVPASIRALAPLAGVLPVARRPRSSPQTVIPGGVMVRLLRLAPGGSKRLLAQEVLAGVQCPANEIEVSRVRRANAHHVRPRKELFERSADGGIVELPLLGARCGVAPHYILDRYELRPWLCGIRAHVRLGYPDGFSGTDDAYLELFHMLPRCRLVLYRSPRKQPLHHPLPPDREGFETAFGGELKNLGRRHSTLSYHSRTTPR